LLDPVIVSKPWGGRRLEIYGKTLPPEGTFGESWDIADLPEADVTSSRRSRSAIAGGPLAGASLHEAIGHWGEALLGSAAATAAGDFPLLYKLLDARENLSVQVHPDEGYQALHPAASLKTESWYIVDAEPGSVIYKDVKPGVSVEDVAAVANTSGLVDLLQPVPAETGAFHHLPAGLVHAIGAGVLIAEPQTPSDTTFRLYDWTDEYGRAPRTLHVDQALDAMRIHPPGAISLDPADRSGTRSLITTTDYWVREHFVVSDSGPLSETRELRILSVLDGEAEVSHANQVTDLVAGSTIVIPAAIAPDVLVATTAATMLEIGLAGAPG
jgi:mannose-6-phosphate isomerase